LRAQETGEKLTIADLRPHFERQFNADEELSYPLFTWSKNTKLDDFGFVETARIQPAGSGSSHPYAVKLIVNQRLSDREALVEVRIESHNPLLGLVSSRSNSPMILRNMQRPYESFHFAFVGFDFKNIADDSELTYTGGIRCSGLYEYQNTLGAKKSISCIQPILLPEIPHPATLGFGVRTWSDRTGKFSISACFDSYNAGRLTLIKEADGTPVEVQLSVLSTSDQKWVRDKLREDREAGKRIAETVHN
jgi:hypothetical protein